MPIKHDNIVYVRDISEIGGVLWKRGLTKLLKSIGI